MSTGEAKSGSQLPLPKQFLMGVGLYGWHELSRRDLENLLKLMLFSGTIDAYCPKCKKESTFQRLIEYDRVDRFLNQIPTEIDILVLCILQEQCLKEGGKSGLFESEIDTYIAPRSHPVIAASRGGFGVPGPENVDLVDKLKAQAKPGAKHIAWLENFLFADRWFRMSFACTRETNHRMFFHFIIDEGQLAKVGQYPSIRDLESHSTEKYKKVLEGRYPEYNTAVGLYAHGIGIGSFVYLRRILEDLIEQAHNKARVHDTWDEDTYSRSRVVEKIKLLDKFLPTFIVDHATIYSILSKGLHELSEEECKLYFPALKSAIDLILDQEIERRDREKKVIAASKTIQKIAGEIKKPD